MSEEYARAAHRLDQALGLLAAVLGEELYEPLLLDVPSTVLWALGIPLPDSYAGRPLYESVPRRPGQFK